MIIIGYPGIGKTTLSGRGLGYIDLESGCFNFGGEKIENWHKVYVKLAKYLSRQGYRVFVSSHDEVREALRSYDDVYIIYPSLELKDEWVERLRKRYDESEKEKDRRAWLNAEHNYEKQIKELMNEDTFKHIVIDNMHYRLSGMIWENKRSK